MNKFLTIVGAGWWIMMAMMLIFLLFANLFLPDMDSINNTKLRHTDRDAYFAWVRERLDQEADDCWFDMAWDAAQFHKSNTGYGRPKIRISTSGYNFRNKGDAVASGRNSNQHPYFW